MFLLVGLCLLAGPAFVRADEDAYDEAFDEGEDMEEMEYLEDEIPDDADGAFRPADIRTTVIFPDHEGGKPFVAGEPVTALVGVWNAGDETYNLSYCGASFHSPYDYNYYIQNFTVQQSSVFIAPQTLEYTFTPDARLEAVEYFLSGWVIYNDTEGQLYRAVWTNATVALEEKASEVNARVMFAIVVVLAFCGGAVYLAMEKMANTKGAKIARAQRADAAAASSSEGPASTAKADDWGEIYTPKSAKGKRKSSKKRK